jgi:hypothetical protein
MERHNRFVLQEASNLTKMKNKWRYGTKSFLKSIQSINLSRLSPNVFEIKVYFWFYKKPDKCSPFWHTLFPNSLQIYLYPLNEQVANIIESWETKSLHYTQVRLKKGKSAHFCESSNEPSVYIICGEFLTSYATSSRSRRAVLHEVILILKCWGQDKY